MAEPDAIKAVGEASSETIGNAVDEAGHEAAVDEAPVVPRHAAQARIIGPILPRLRVAGALSIGASLLWPLQAGLIAWVISLWVAGEAALAAVLPAVLLFVAFGLLRAGLEHLAGRLLFAAADETIARERGLLIQREARSPCKTSSAAIAALTVQKLPMLSPWITRYAVAMMRVAVLPLVLAAIAFWISWASALILLIAGPMIPIFMALIGLAAEDASRRQMYEIASMNAMLMDRLSAMLDIRLLGATGRAATDFENRAEALREKTMAVLRVAFLSSTVLELFSALGVAMMAVFVGFTLLGELNFGTWGAELTLGQGLFLLLIAPEFFQPMRELASAWHDRAAGYAVVSELEALDGAERAALLGKGASAAPLCGAASVCLTRAIAAYPNAHIALPDFTLTAGEALALTGASGAGKTTALAAIAGLVPLISGSISVCGQALDAKSADGWRARLAYVPQRPHFPDMPLGDWLDPKQTGADPWPALERANARQIVERLPQGLQTRLGAMGGGVSGGEARRLMIARAVMSGGDMILADEPTADLDPEAAALVIEALLRLKAEGRGLIVATHDPALASAMDRQIGVGP